MFTAEKNKYPLSRYIKLPAALLFWLVVWITASEIVGMELLIPSPYAVLESFISLAKEKDFYISCFNSLYKVVLGWGAGLIAGVILGIITSLSSVLKTLFEPLLYIIKATPVASFIVLALVLMSSKKVPVFTCALISVPIVWANISEGINSPDKKLLEMASFFNMNRKKKLTDIYIPATLPYFSAAAKTAMGLSWKAGIAAEVICTPSGTIGAGISNAKIYLESPSLFAWTITVIILSVILEKLLGFVLKKHGGTL
ncbi:MAG: ABC transporter permease subunit [Clostridia bacterium]|nr:ABC transporter permease subunit [Clostridia bacterium]